MALCKFLMQLLSEMLYNDLWNASPQNRHYSSVKLTVHPLIELQMSLEGPNPFPYDPGFSLPFDTSRNSLFPLADCRKRTFPSPASLLKKKASDVINRGCFKA